MNKVKRVCVDAITHFNDDDGWAFASHVALSITMALFPFLVFAAAMVGFLGGEARSSDLVDFVFDAWPDQVAEPIAREINVVLTNSRAEFLTLGIGLALIFASNGVEAVRVALNRAYRVTEDRSFIFCRLQSLLFVFVGGVILFFVSFILIILPLLSEFAENSVPFLKKGETAGWFLRQGLAFATLAFAVFACHAWLPAGKRPIPELWPGILATLVTWLVAAGIFTQYLERIADYSLAFAGLAGVMTALIFLYLMAAILILGGELNAALLDHRKVEASQAPAARS